MVVLDHDPIFRALSDGSRRAIFERLCREGELTVGRLTEGSGISQPAISKHLAVLRDGGLVEGRKAGRATYYRALPARLAPLDDWTEEMRGFWHARFDDLDGLLKRMDN
jgi:DNA-binding transcriptional ArsR family regulator